MLVLSQYVETAYASELIGEDTAGIGYLLWRDAGMAGIVHHLDTMERTGA